MLAKKISVLLATASIGIVTLCAVAFPSQGVNGIHAESSPYSVTFTAGDAVTDSYGTYLLTDFGCKVYFANIENVAFGSVSDGYLFRFNNGGYLRWDTGTTPKDGVGSISANGFKHLKSISLSWSTALVGINFHIYGGNFTDSHIYSSGETATDADGTVTNTYLNAAWDGSSGTYCYVTSMTITYTCD